jgi:hypothetical protein
MYRELNKRYITGTTDFVRIKREREFGAFSKDGLTALPLKVDVVIFPVS